MASPSIVDEILRNNTLLARDVVAHGRTWLALSNGVLNIYGPLATADAQRIGKLERVSQIQFAEQFDVPVATLQGLDRHVLRKHPDAALRVTLNGAGAFDDLQFLRYLSQLRSLLADGNHALDLVPIATYVALVSLGVGGLGTSLRPLRDYRSLEQLAVSDRVTDFDTIGTLANLEGLSIDDRCPARLEFLAALPRLRAISLGGAAPKHFDDLAAAPALEDLALAGIKVDAAALEPVGHIAGLVRLSLRELTKVTSLGWLKNQRLEELELAGISSIRSLAPLASLPSLKMLTLDQPVTAAQLGQLASAPALKVVKIREGDLPKVAARSLPFRIEAI